MGPPCGCVIRGGWGPVSEDHGRGSDRFGDGPGFPPCYSREGDIAPVPLSCRDRVDSVARIKPHGKATDCP